MRAYHFLRADMTAREGNEPAWEVGEKRTYDGAIVLCESGYHSSPTLWDALRYAPGPVACLVEISEAVHRDETKQVSATRKLVKAVNIEKGLRLFVADCVERVLSVYERECPGDDRPRKATEAARAYAGGEIDDAAEASRGAWTARDASAAEIKWQREHFDEMFGGIFGDGQ